MQDKIHKLRNFSIAQVRFIGNWVGGDSWDLRGTRAGLETTQRGTVRRRAAMFSMGHVVLMTLPEASFATKNPSFHKSARSSKKRYKHKKKHMDPSHIQPI